MSNKCAGIYLYTYLMYRADYCLRHFKLVSYSIKLATTLIRYEQLTSNYTDFPQSFHGFFAKSLGILYLCILPVDIQQNVNTVGRISFLNTS